METIKQTLTKLPPKLELPWGNPPKPNLWSCKIMTTANNQADERGGFAYYQIRSPVLKKENPLTMKFHWKRGGNVNIKVYSPYGDVIPTLTVPSQYTLELALKYAWKALSDRDPDLPNLFNTKVASAKKTKAKKRKPNPKSIDRYVKEYAEQKGYGSAEDIPSNEKGKAYAIAWSRYCSKRPGSPRCKKDKGTYFPKRPNIAKGIAKSMEEKRRKRTKKKASAFNVADRHIKVASQSPTSLKDLFEKDYQSLRLSWGKPAKPNLWDCRLSQTTKAEKRYLVNSPVLLKPLVISFQLFEGALKNEFVNIEVLQHEWVGTNTLAKMNPNARADFDQMMVNLWDNILWENRGGAHKYLKPNVKVAATQPANLLEILNKKPDTFQLAWGSPVKKNLWHVTKEYENNNQVSYTVQSPVLNLDLGIEVLGGKRVDFYVHLITKEGRMGSTFYAYKMRHDNDLLTMPLDSFMSRVWEAMSEEIGKHKGTPVFKPNVKVASREPYATTREVFRRRPLTVELAWGNPPKKNLWSAQLRNGGSTDYYHIESPALKPNTSLELRIQRKMKGYYVNINMLNPNASDIRDKIKGLTYWDIKEDDPILEQSFESFTRFLWSQLVTKGLTDFILNPNIKVASASGRYGYTKKVQKDCELAVSQLQKYCRALCSKQKSKGDRHLEFYRVHAEKSGSPFVKAFVQCHKDIYNEALSKIATSMYGYDEKTVKRCLSNINDLQIRSAMLINKLLARKTSDSDKIKAYLSEHIEQTGCVWSTCLYSCL